MKKANDAKVEKYILYSNAIPRIFCSWMTFKKMLDFAKYLKDLMAKGKVVKNEGISVTHRSVRLAQLVQYRRRKILFCTLSSLTYVMMMRCKNLRWGCLNSKLGEDTSCV